MAAASSTETFISHLRRLLTPCAIKPAALKSVTPILIGAGIKFFIINLLTTLAATAC